MAKPDNEEPGSPGWEAIDQALARIYGAGEPPHHYGTVLPYMLGGRDLLQGISVYERDKPVPHWHYITYGFTELYDKESDDPEVSGFGFELTFRLARREKKPPAWALNFLQNLARYVFQTGNAFDEGHHLDCNGPIALGKKTDLQAVAFTKDNELGPVRSPNGKFRFLQVVGITSDELLQVKKWNCAGFLNVLEQHIPLLITDLKRKSILSDESIRKKIERRASKEGSSTGVLFVGEASFSREGKQLEVILGANAVGEIKEVLPARLGFDRELVVVSSKARISFRPGRSFRWQLAEGQKQATITLTPEQAGQLGELLQPRAGRYSSTQLPGLVFHVRKSEITDQDGNVVEVIG